MTIYEKQLEDLILQAKIAKGETLTVDAGFLSELAKEHLKIAKENEKLTEENQDVTRYIMGDDPYDKDKNIPEGNLEYQIYWVLWHAFWKNEAELESMLRLGHKQNYCNKAARMLTYGIKELGGKFNNAEEVNEWLTYGEDEG